ncbi:MAG: rhomboid family intramembrane serine protease [Methylobacteriaceae bacterium]|nr:rhomboid family intramembrane serine protease [Methylobacteriaceae bacterium]
MFVPLYDGVPLRYLRFPIANWSIIAGNIVVFLWVQAAPSPDRIETALGAIPAVLFGRAILSPDLALVPASVTLITGMFVHANIGHIFGNMLFLWVFGDNVEDAMGSLRYLVFYLACGIIAALTFSAMVPSGQSPLIGASGAISGVATAYLLLYPKARIWGFLFIPWLPLHIPATWFVGIWIFFQILSALLSEGSDIGWWAHLGGIGAGCLLVGLFKRRQVPLFGPAV